MGAVPKGCPPIWSSTRHPLAVPKDGLSSQVWTRRGSFDRKNSLSYSRLEAHTIEWGVEGR